MHKATAERNPRRNIRRAPRLLAWILSLGLAGALPATAAPEEIKPFQATYNWIWHGLAVAQTTLDLQHQDGDYWLYRSRSEPRGIGRLRSERPTQQSLMQVTESGVRPVSYKADDGTSSTKRDADVRFDWAQHRMSGVYEDAKVDMPLPPQIQDDLSIQVALMVELLAGRTPEHFSLLSGNSVREYRYSADGEATLTTPVGTVHTLIYKSEKQYSPRVTRFWCAPSLGYVPLRVEQTNDGDVEWTMEIQQLKRE